MKDGLKEGMKLTHTKIVGSEETAAKIASGTLEVYGTPYLVAFMEKTSLDIVAPFLDENESTVGIAMNMKHLRANKVGDEISCESTLVKIEGRKLTFEVKAMYKDIVIGEGVHERFVIDVNKFLSKLN
ncbi:MULTISPECIES: thioesterase family protein [Fusobacterium]|uniref:thioesterase family protein n=1 Tax=Fusobacterium TaxID=848 RepID=UPI001476FBEC|nr:MULTISPECIES: thioesterase family protein [Fusobacterium]NME35639.1 thioesterase family protein [Fusobacterium sp. FSA-380-WT-3A]